MSTFADVLLDSHEKGPPSFLGGSAGAALVVADGGGAGGGANCTEGRFPERPWSAGGGFNVWLEGFAALSLDVMVVERDLEEVASCAFSSWTSSIEEIESRRISN